MTLGEMFARLTKSLKKQTEKKWSKSKVRCKKCGTEWSVIYPKIPGGETKLQCPECGARESEVIT